MLTFWRPPNSECPFVWLSSAITSADTQTGGLFPLTRMHLSYPEAYLGSGGWEEGPQLWAIPKTTAHHPLGLFVHNHTNVANPEQLRLATFFRPTFFCRRPSLPRQRAGKLLPTPLFSQLRADKQPLWSWCLDSNCGRGLQAFFHHLFIYLFFGCSYLPHNKMLQPINKKKKKQQSPANSGHVIRVTLLISCAGKTHMTLFNPIVQIQYGFTLSKKSRLQNSENKPSMG